MLFDFKKLMVTRLFYTLGVQMQAVVVGWQMYELTKDPLSLGLIGLAEAIPALGLALWAGNVVDRQKPLVLFRLVLVVSLISTLIVLICSWESFQFSVNAKTFLLYLASFLTGMARSFSQPTIFSAVPRIVPIHQLGATSAWMSATSQVGRIGGPAIGGVLFGFMGMQFTVSIIAVLIFLAILTVSTMEHLHLPPAKKQTEQNQSESFFSGLTFVWNHPIMFPALALDMFSVLFGSVTALLPIYCQDILMVGPKGLGMLRAAPAVGALILSLVLVKFPYQKNAGVFFLSSVAGFGLSLLVFSISTNYHLSLICLLMSGAFDSVSVVIRTAIVQLHSPDHMRGRISAVNTIFIGSSNELGALESGIAAKLMGTVPSAILGSSLCLAIVGFVTFKSQALRKMKLDNT
jgi:MFS family permease